LDNRFYLQALGITSLFIALLILFWSAGGGTASEAAVQNANLTRTALAMTGSYLLQPRTRTPFTMTDTPASIPQTSTPLQTSTLPALASPTNTSLLEQFSTPLSPIASFTPFPTGTAAVQVPGFTATLSGGQPNTKAPPIFQGSPAPAGAQSPDAFARWYFTRVWNERDYQNLWDNFLTASFKANVGSGLFADYVLWWDSVERVEIHSVDVLQNNGVDAWVRVDLTFHMKDGRVVQNQVYEYDFLYDSSRGTWMFDASG
jgi:hypothetical protein